MSALADEIVNTLAKKRKENRLTLLSATVDEILAELNIHTTATKAVPVPLRATRIHFRGHKRLVPSHPDAHGHHDYVDDEHPGEDFDGNPDPTTADVVRDEVHTHDGEITAKVTALDAPEPKVRRVLVPFAFEWHPQLGVNGIGSGRNLRGKSTVLNVLMWSLTGRCARFQPDIKRWIEHVEVEWTVGTERLRVSFDAKNGEATGRVDKLGNLGGPDKLTLLGTFDGTEFESVMESLMMTRLRLEKIPVWASTKATLHSWPSYSSAFVVRANQLDPIVGNEQTLSVRMMQMFIGTDWAPAQAAAMTARRSMENQTAAATDKAKAAGDAVEANRTRALESLRAVESQITNLPVGTPNLATMLQSATLASELAREVHALETRLLAQSSIAETTRQQLKSAKARRHTDYEHALATKFFNRMRPSACPRCTAEVTTARQAAEPEKHECSVCSSDLNLDALNADVIIAASVPDQIANALIDQTASTERVDASSDIEEAPRDEIEALEEALNEAESAIADLIAQITARTAARDQAVDRAETGGNSIAAADRRRLLELDLARAEGALAALTESATPTAVDPVDPILAAVAETAEQVLKKRVKHDQDPLLEKIGAEIERLAVSFGADNLSHIRLDGAANMSLLKSGDPATYTGITEGEKLRVKIATAISLIKHGYVEGIGRHPGLLILDSPAAEEMPEKDLATMVKALTSVAEEAEMQIFVATRHGRPLIDLLPAPSRVVAEGDAYVW